MCELKVSVNTANGSQPIAEDVVYANLEKGHILLKDVLGATREVPDALITTLDIGREHLSLKRSPMVGAFLRFLAACESAETSRNTAETEESWNELKAKGDEAVRSLWRKYGRSS
jgi:predicted RNA-binding protein